MGCPRCETKTKQVLYCHYRRPLLIEEQYITTTYIELITLTYINKQTRKERMRRRKKRQHLYSYTKIKIYSKHISLRKLLRLVLHINVILYTFKLTATI